MTNYSHADMSLKDTVRSSLQQYFMTLKKQTPCDLYQLLLSEVEPPLLEVVMQQAQGNQTRAAQMLGINRGTLRKKLKQYGLDN